MEKELATIIGNEPIKEFIRSLAAQVKVNQKRQELGLQTQGNGSYHMIFKGNPGTGKTTIARLVGELLNELGVLKKGAFVETDRSKLVGNYIGVTEKNTSEIIQESLGGVLFIDEAYSLVRKQSPNDFGQIAIDLVLKSMEDYRENLVVIAAGYEEKMEEFVASNPGLKSRFTNYVHFHDYKEEEMYGILLMFTGQNGYILTPTATNAAMFRFNKEIESGESSNGRFVRNLFENATRNLSVRVAAIESPTVKELTVLEAKDFLS